ncbi:hypothetical protein Dda_9001 [Drechslerella dactyloides]|uniref:Apple domain-containing protein n=1 Tax=Drechslerella dactyloides TaxID=74499 RepID=A0AAD6NEM4_DREDA|nr:hypothetical protein Dda_9001 [Drechslerella dactyloides]
MLTGGKLLDDSRVARPPCLLIEIFLSTRIASVRFQHRNNPDGLQITAPQPTTLISIMAARRDRGDVRQWVVLLVLLRLISSGLCLSIRPRDTITETITDYTTRHWPVFYESSCGSSDDGSISGSPGTTGASSATGTEGTGSMSSPQVTTITTSTDGTLTTITSTISPGSSGTGTGGGGGTGTGTGTGTATSATSTASPVADLFLLVAVIGNDIAYVDVDDADYAVLIDGQPSAQYSYSNGIIRLTGDDPRFLYALLSGSGRRRQASQDGSVRASSIIPAGAQRNFTIEQINDDEISLTLNVGGQSALFGTRCLLGRAPLNGLNVFVNTLPQQAGCVPVQLRGVRPPQPTGTTGAPTGTGTGTGTGGGGGGTGTGTTGTGTITSSPTGSFLPCQTPIEANRGIRCIGEEIERRATTPNGRRYLLCLGEIRPPSATLRIVPNLVVAGCALECSRDFSCTGFAFNRNTAECTLFSSVSRVGTVDSTYYFGIFKCDGTGTNSDTGTDTGTGTGTTGTGTTGTGTTGTGNETPTPPFTPRSPSPTPCRSSVINNYNLTCYSADVNFPDASAASATGTVDNESYSVTMCYNTEGSGATQTQIADCVATAIAERAEAFEYDGSTQGCLPIDDSSNTNIFVPFSPGLENIVVGFIMCNDYGKPEPTCDFPVAANADLLCPDETYNQTYFYSDQQYVICYDPSIDDDINQLIDTVVTSTPLQSCAFQCGNEAGCIGFAVDQSTQQCTSITTTVTFAPMTGNADLFVAFATCKDVAYTCDAPGPNFGLYCAPYADPQSITGFSDGRTYQGCLSEAVVQEPELYSIRSYLDFDACAELCDMIDDCTSFFRGIIPPSSAVRCYLGDGFNASAIYPYQGAGGIGWLRCGDTPPQPDCVNPSIDSGTECQDDAVAGEGKIDNGRPFRLCLGEAHSNSAQISITGANDISLCADYCNAQFACASFQYSAAFQTCRMYGDVGSSSSVDNADTAYAWFTCDDQAPPVYGDCPDGYAVNPSTPAMSSCVDNSLPVIGDTYGNTWRACIGERVSGLSPLTARTIMTTNLTECDLFCESTPGCYFWTILDGLCRPYQSYDSTTTNAGYTSGWPLCLPVAPSYPPNPNCADPNDAANFQCFFGPRTSVERTDGLTTPDGRTYRLCTGQVEETYRGDVVIYQTFEGISSSERCAQVCQNTIGCGTFLLWANGTCLAMSAALFGVQEGTEDDSMGYFVCDEVTNPEQCADPEGQNVGLCPTGVYTDIGTLANGETFRLCTQTVYDQTNTNFITSFIINEVDGGLTKCAEVCNNGRFWQSGSCVLWTYDSQSGECSLFTQFGVGQNWERDDTDTFIAGYGSCNTPSPDVAQTPDCGMPINTAYYSCLNEDPNNSDNTFLFRRFIQCVGQRNNGNVGETPLGSGISVGQCLSACASDSTCAGFTWTTSTSGASTGNCVGVVAFGDDLVDARDENGDVYTSYIICNY